jgi:ribonuclease E
LPAQGNALADRQEAAASASEQPLPAQGNAPADTQQAAASAIADTGTASMAEYAAEQQSAQPDDPDLPAFAPAAFPESFGDASTEDFFTMQADAGGSGQADALNSSDAPADDSVGEKKRRSRSRRGRGRKKSAMQAVSAQEKTDAAGALSPDELDKLEPATAAPEYDDYDESRGDDDDAQPRAGFARKDGQADEEAFGNEEEQTLDGKAPRRKMFVSILPDEQVEVVITEEGSVQEYYVEMLHQAKTKGNIYKAVIHNVDPNLQAAFVSYGAIKNGFLQIDEIHPEYYITEHDDSKGRKYPSIQKVIKPGQEVLVQVVKEPAGTKGAFLTTYLSLPGRFLVLTPGREQIGDSRKVENEHERARLRELLEGLNPGSGLGVIVRTVSMGASKTSLQRDLQYLKRTWKDVRTRGTTEKAPSLIYQEEDLTTRAVRDYLTEAVGEVWIDDETTANSVSEIAEALFPRKQNLVRAHKDPAATLFERFNLQRQLDQIHSREVSLPSGGRLVIDPTEALTAIDINSGRSGGKNNFEDMAYRTNMEAARMIPLQLRLRDIGGQIVADFIEMRDKSHWREVEKTLRNGMKIDRARYDVGKIGPFGMLEIVRQRLGSSAISVSTEPCPCCNGTGVRRNMEWQSQHALRDIHRALRNAQTQNQSEILYQTEQPLALHLLNNKRQRLLEMEQNYSIRIDIRIAPPSMP